MGSAARRLKKLEAAWDVPGPGEREAAIRREVLSRMTDEELHAYEAVLSRVEARGEVGHDGREILSRIDELTELVTKQRKGAT